MTWLSLINGLTKLFNGLLVWWREKSIYDTGVNEERLRAMQAEAKANAKSEKIQPLDRDSVVGKLRDGGF